MIDPVNSDGAMYRNDWQFTENVVDAGFAYGPDRYVTGLAAAPASGVKVREGNPTQNQIAVAASSHGFKATDKVFTLWTNTLRADPGDETTELISPEEGDRLTVDSVMWVIKSVKPVVYYTQAILYCQRSTAAVSP